MAERQEILHYTGYPHDRGGIVAVIRALRAEGRFRVVHGVGAGFEASGSPMETWVGPRTGGERINWRELWRARAVARSVRAWLTEDSRRIFHGHSRTGLLVALWLRLMGERRAAVTVHCYGHQRWFYRLARILLGPRLQWLTPAMKRYYYGARAAVTWDDCIPNGLPGSPAPTMRRPTPGKPLRIGGAGMITAEKNWDLIVDALALLPAAAPVQYFHLGGPINETSSVQYAAELRRRAEEVAPGRMHWLGWQNSSGAWLNEVDVVVVPLETEAFSLIALEALFAGVPVIAARGGGPDDLIRPGENGWLVAPRDPAALAGQIMQCLNAERWSGLRVDEARMQRFTASRVSRQWETIYSQLCGQR